MDNSETNKRVLYCFIGKIKFFKGVFSMVNKQDLQLAMYYFSTTF